MHGKKGNENPKYPPSRGVPAKETFWLPSHDGKYFSAKGGLDKNIIWSVEDVIDFIFPRLYQPMYFEIACGFMKLVMENEKLKKEEISEFLKNKKYSKSTLENKIIPKLVRFGLIKRERETAKEGKSRYLILSDSLTFANYLERIASAWNMLVSTARQKRKQKSP